MKLTIRDTANATCFLHALCPGFVASILPAYHAMHGNDQSDKYLQGILHGIIDRAMKNCPSELSQPFVFYDEEFAVVMLPLLRGTIECRLEWTERMGTQYITGTADEEIGKISNDLDIVLPSFPENTTDDT